MDLWRTDIGTTVGPTTFAGVGPSQFCSSVIRRCFGGSRSRYAGGFMAVRCRRTLVTNEWSSVGLLSATLRGTLVVRWWSTGILKRSSVNFMAVRHRYQGGSLSILWRPAVNIEAILHRVWRSNVNSKAVFYRFFGGPPSALISGPLSVLWRPTLNKKAVHHRFSVGSLSEL